MEKKFKEKAGKSWSARGSAGHGTANAAARKGKGTYERTF